MAKIELHPDFRDFLKLLNSQGVEYLLVGGYAVGYHGYPRSTGDMDIWIAVDETNAEKTAGALREFGMPENEVDKNLFLGKDHIIRMGVPPVRIEVITGASGVNFRDCYLKKTVADVDGIPVNFISLDDLKVNKMAAGRHKDLEDLQHLP
jgi:predicted nucleotidyltransferase